MYRLRALTIAVREAAIFTPQLTYPKALFTLIYRGIKRLMIQHCRSVYFASI